MSVLITGASGAICTKLSQKLIKNNIPVNFLTANLNKTSENQNIYYWNPQKNIIDKRAFEGVSTIVHLAGAGIANARWTAKRKGVLLSSRTQTAALLLTTIKSLNKTIKKYISAGAIGIFEEGIYNADEHSKQGNDFMANLCKEWENTVEPYKNEGMDTTLFRTGIVLDQKSGFYAEIAKMAKYYLASVPGSGKQWVSWISMEDMVDMYYEAIVNPEITGTYNATAPEPERLSTIIKSICKQENRKLLLPNAPSFILRLIFGEMAQVILSDKHVIPDKWLSEKRSFKHNNLKEMYASWNQ